MQASLLQVARLLTQLIEDNRSQSEARSQIIWSQQRQLEARQKRNRLKQVCPASKAAWSAVWVFFCTAETARSVPDPGSAGAASPAA